MDIYTKLGEEVGTVEIWDNEVVVTLPNGFKANFSQMGLKKTVYIKRAEEIFKLESEKEKYKASDRNEIIENIFGLMADLQEDCNNREFSENIVPAMNLLRELKDNVVIIECKTKCDNCFFTGCLSDMCNKCNEYVYFKPKQ